MLRKIWNGFTDPQFCTLFDHNIETIDKENRSQLLVLNALGTGLMAAVYIMTFIFPYMLVMRRCYTPFLVLYLLNYIAALTVAKKSRVWIYICAYTIALTTMAFGVVLGIFRNPDNNANLFMVFLIVVPLMFLERPLVIFFSTLVCCAAFSVMTYMIKEPAQYQTDLTNCWVCFFISTVTARAMNRARMSSIEARRQLYMDSVTDPLTKLPNRRSLNAFLRGIRPALLSGSGRAALFIIDIDYFKKYNDSYGHVAGDECLIAVGEIFSRLAETEGIWIYRFGGEEFIAIATDRSIDADALGSKIVESIYEADLPYKRSEHGRLTVSVGGCDSAVYPKYSDVDLINFADIALYRAKEYGRNCFVPYHEVKWPEILP